MTNENLSEYKSILISLIKEENNKFYNKDLRINYIWKNLNLKEFDYNKYLADIYIQDLFKLYEKIFFESKILSIQAISYISKENVTEKNNNSNQIFIEEINKDTNLYMKVITSNLNYFNDEKKINEISKQLINEDKYDDSTNDDNNNKDDNDNNNKDFNKTNEDISNNASKK